MLMLINTRKRNLLRLTIIAVLLLHGQFCSGQSILPDAPGNDDLSNLSDTLIRQEIASFTVQGILLEKTTPALTISLTEVPVRRCTDSTVYLNSGSTYIHLYFKGTI